MKLKEYIKNKKIDLSRNDRVFELSQLVIHARGHAKLTQKELAKRMKSQQSTISAVENGENEPSIEFLERVAEATGAKLIYPSFNFIRREGGSTSYIAANISEPKLPILPVKSMYRIDPNYCLQQGKNQLIDITN